MSRLPPGTSAEVSFGGGSDARTILPQNEWNYRITVSQPIFAGLREQRAYQQAKLGTENAREGVRAAEDQTLARVASDCLGVVEGDALITVEQRNVALAESRLTQSKNFYEAGEVTRVDVLRAEAAVKGAQRRLAAAEQLRDTAAGRLRIDLAMDGPITVADPAIGAETLPGEEALIRRALTERPEIDQAQNNIRIAQLEVSKQRGAYLPVITADAAYIQQKSTFPSDSYGQAAIRFSIPIWQGGEVAARIDFAKRQEELAMQTLAELEQVVREDVRKALLDLRAAETNRALAADQLAAAEAEYEQTFDLQAAESSLMEARRAAMHVRRRMRRRRPPPVPQRSRASICSVTRIDPISAAIAEPTRPVNMRATRTGESSRSIGESHDTADEVFGMHALEPGERLRAMTMPVKRVVKKTTGIESVPIRTICRSHSATSTGGRNSVLIVRHRKTTKGPWPRRGG